MFRLDCAVQHYAWGSTTHLPELLGVDRDGRPFAELWMGAHALGPSTIRPTVPVGADAPTSLPDLLRDAPLDVVGPRVLAEVGPALPYLFKVLAIARPVSLQVHPTPEQARDGFAREQAAGIPMDAPHRCFKDDQHKPELVVALSRFEALTGFRPVREVLDLLRGLPGAFAARMRAPLEADPTGDGLRDAFAALLALTPADEVAELVQACADRLTTGSPDARADRTVGDLARWYPGDPGAAAALFLHRLTLEPGEALYVPAGVVHTYLEGYALELMACSDNVLRAGLTSKHVDVPALLECTRYEPAPPSRPEAHRVDRATSEYRSPAQELGVAVTTVDDDAWVGSLPPAGPRLVVCVDGAVELATSAHSLTLGRGDVVLVTDADGAVQARGTGSVATAFAPVAGSPSAAADGDVLAAATATAPGKTNRR